MATIDLTLTEEQRALKAGVAEICRRYPGEYWRDLDARREYPEKFVDELTRAGYLAALIPQEYGGAGLRIRDGALILETIHASRIAEAETAKVRAINQQVHDYASGLSDAHREALAAVSALEKKLSLTPADSKMSLTIAATSSVEVENLAGAASADFDRVYMQAQVSDHGKTMSAVDSLLGMTTNGEIKSSLTALKMMAKDEHGQATMIAASL